MNAENTDSQNKTHNGEQEEQSKQVPPFPEFYQAETGGNRDETGHSKANEQQVP